MTAGPSAAWISELLAPSAPELLAEARQMRDAHHGPRVRFSRKVFISLTRLYRDVCTAAHWIAEAVQSPSSKKLGILIEHRKYLIRLGWREV
jgi:hypothetical protein